MKFVASPKLGTPSEAVRDCRGSQLMRYQESCGGCSISVVTEQVIASGVETLRRVKTVLVTRNGVKLAYQAPPYAGPDEEEIVKRALDEARDFVGRHVSS